MVDSSEKLKIPNNKEGLIPFSKLLIDKPEPVKPDCDDIIPDKRKTGIVVLFENNLLNIISNNKC